MWQKTFRVLYMGRGTYRALAVASVDEKDGEPREWSAYIGGCLREDEPYSWNGIRPTELGSHQEEVRRNGHKLRPVEARSMFPELAEVPYRR